MTARPRLQDRRSGEDYESRPPSYQQRVVRSTTSKQRQAHYEELLKAAIERADLAVAVVEKMRARESRERVRRLVRKELDGHHLQRRSTARLLRFAFYGNFIVLAALFYFVGGVHLTNGAAVTMSLARLAGLLGSYLLLVQLVLVARVPLLDWVYGMDRLTRWHKHNGRLSFTLIVLHAVAAVLGRTLTTHIAALQMIDTVVGYRFMPAAVVGLGLITLTIVTSVLAVRKRLSFDRWHLIHAWTYVGVALSFGHQIYGPDFQNNLFACAYIWFAYGFTAALIAYCRICLPLLKTFRHQLRVAQIVEEGPGVNSIYMTGFNLDRLKWRPGQFCYWRFITPNFWLEAHPFSLSTAPNDKFLRITVKSLGDFTSSVHTIPIGTWVTFEGPFGGFTPERRRHLRSVLIAGGVGITPVRSLLEGMKSAPGDIKVIYRANRLEDAALLDELRTLADKRNAVLHVVIGAPDQFPATQQPLSSGHLRHLVPDITQRDVFICASPGMTAGVRGTLKSIGLQSNQVHHETFA